MTETGLAGIRVVETAGQIAGPYCGKLLVDGGAEVIKVEPPEGDPLRRWSAGGVDLAGRDGALFSFLNAGKSSVVGALGDDEVHRLLGGADLLVHAHGLTGDGVGPADIDAIRAAHPHLVVVVISPYGTTGPWADRRATEFTLQAEGGSIGLRGVPGSMPFQAGGRITEWAAGAYAAAAALPAVRRSRRTGVGEVIDLSLLETANTVFSNLSVTMNRLVNGSCDPPVVTFAKPGIETPSVEPTADGYVGFCTNSRQQFNDFLVMIDRADLLADDDLAQFSGRGARLAEWTEIVHGWTLRRTTAEIVELASLYRIPVSTVGNGRTLLEHEHLVARGVFVPGPDGSYQQPRRPYRIDDEAPPGPRPAPRLGQGVESAADRRPTVVAVGAEPEPPLRGLRVLDLTAWWAGPAAAHILATLGATVVHVESPSRIDGMRSIGGMMMANYPQWWEASPHFMHANSNKLGLTLELTTDRGRELLDRLVQWCDVVLENYTPRVMEQFGIDWPRIQALNPAASFVRMPAFGLSGPWADRPGFAQTMEQLSGLAWVSGHPGDQPRNPRGPLDPIAGVHAAFAIMVALGRRDQDGRGHFVENTMAEAALNVAAEQVLEWSAYGNLLERDGNRSPGFAPQGIYPCRGGDTPASGLLALSIATDDDWQRLRDLLGSPEWATDPDLGTPAGRRARHDEIDEHLAEWTRGYERDELVETLRAGGLIASAVADPARLAEHNPQLAARRYFEAPQHPVVGPMTMPTLPFRYASIGTWLRSPAPTVGQHNRQVLVDMLGCSEDELHELEAAGVIGTRPNFGGTTA